MARISVRLDTSTDRVFLHVGGLGTFTLAEAMVFATDLYNAIKAAQEMERPHPFELTRAAEVMGHERQPSARVRMRR